MAITHVALHGVLPEKVTLLHDYLVRNSIGPHLHWEYCNEYGLGSSTILNEQSYYFPLLNNLVYISVIQFFVHARE